MSITLIQLIRCSFSILRRPDSDYFLRFFLKRATGPGSGLGFCALALRSDESNFPW